MLAISTTGRLCRIASDSSEANKSACGAMMQAPRRRLFLSAMSFTKPYGEL